MSITRRELLVSASASAACAIAPARSARAQTPTRLIAGHRTLDVNGKAATVFSLHQPDGTAGLFLGPRDRFLVELADDAGVPTIVHWHGQTPPVRQDGVANTGLEPLIMPGTSQGYDYAARPGTYWMHSHHGLQEQQLLTAPLIVRTKEDLQADTQEVVVMLHDFTFRDPEEILADLVKGPGMAMGGVGATKGAMAGMNMGSPAASTMGNGNQSMAGMAAGGQSMPGMKMTAPASMPVITTPSGKGTPATGMVMDLNDIDFDAYLANDRTLADPLVVRTERRGRIRLRLINGAASTAFWISFGGAEGTIVAVDGDPVHPIVARRFPVTEAQRVDVLLTMPAGGRILPILAQREGDRQRTGIILATPGARVGKLAAIASHPVGPVDLSLEQQLRAAQPLRPRAADRRHRVTLNGTMSPYRWSIDGQEWPHPRSLQVTTGQRVELDMVNLSQMAHPMHLHGHHFQVTSLNGKAIAGAMRDTVLVPANGTVRVAFDANNPGKWLFHCHNLYHMAAGMMTEVDYTDFS